MTHTMINKIASYVKKTWKSYLFDVALIALVILVLHVWQTRNLLSTDGHTAAPDFILYDLNGKEHQLTHAKGKPVILYFFAPWCSVCHTCISNLEELLQESKAEDLQIFAIALDYEQEKDVIDFVKERHLTFPVLLGNEKLKQDYKIPAYPTYYILNKEGVVSYRSVGYATKLGLMWRLTFL